TCHLYADSSLSSGILLLRNSDFEKARDFFKDKVKENEKDDAAAYYLARTYLILGDYNKAITFIKNAIELKNDVADYHFWLAQALGVKTQNSSAIKQAFLAPKILKEFKRTIELDPAHIDGHVGAANYYLQAPSFMGGGLEKARKEAEIVLKLNEKRGRLIFIGIYEKENKLDLAEQEYEDICKSLDDSTDNHQFYNGYGYFLLKRKKYDKAIEIFEKQVRLTPGEANPHDSLGDGFRAMGKLEEALSEYRKALEIDPNLKASRKKIKELEKKLHKNSR
ncbi:MAG: tetratricopeptide repeat protein, partial [Holophagae bacterium]|nr:tetratricopeptide repeat protein [Holophagae bacterium]